MKRLPPHPAPCPQLYPGGWGLLLSHPVLPPCWCPLGPRTLYQEVAAASLALVCMPFPLVSWATFSSGYLGNQRLRLPGEEGPSLAKKVARYPLFAVGSLRMASRPAHLLAFSEEPRESSAPPIPRQVEGSPLPIGRIGHAAIFTSPHNANVPYFQKGRERKDGEINSRDRAGLIVCL